MGCDCEDCEDMMQPYLDGMLSDEVVTEAREHLARCPGCEKRYRFEERLRHFVRVAADEPMTAALRERLAGLRSTPPAAQL
jgi:anti-sigma factor (TIGR02949 family)